MEAVTVHSSQTFIGEVMQTEHVVLVHYIVAARLTPPQQKEAF